MRISDWTGLTVIVRGTGKRLQYFCFFVDHDSSSWSSWPGNARHFRDEDSAATELAELRRRSNMRRQERTK